MESILGGKIPAIMLDNNEDIVFVNIIYKDYKIEIKPDDYDPIVDNIDTIDIIDVIKYDDFFGLLDYVEQYKTCGEYDKLKYIESIIINSTKNKKKSIFYEEEIV